VAFSRTADDFFDVYIMSRDGKIIEKLVDGQQTSTSEELHLLHPARISWSPDGKSGCPRDEAGAEGRDHPPGGGSTSTRSSRRPPGGSSVRLVAPRRQASRSSATCRTADIFVYDMNAKQLTNVTDDIYSDAQPAWSPDQRHLFLLRPRRLAPARRPPMNELDYSQARPVCRRCDDGAVERPAGLAETVTRARRSCPPTARACCSFGPQRHQQRLPGETSRRGTSGRSPTP